MAMTTRKPLRILFFNLGYATELDGSLKNYLLKFYRYFYTPRRIIRRVRQAIFGLLTSEQPDVFCFVEVHRRHGFVPHAHQYHSYSMANKYGRFSPLRHMPFFHDNCNGFVAREHVPFERMYFRNGTKKLIYKISLPQDITLYLVHFSLRRRTRRRQCRELQEMIQSHKRVVVCGDFNVFRGTKELRRLTENCGLHIVNAHQHTFPAVKPKKALDLFLCSSDLGVPQAKVFTGVRASDHLPVMLEVA